MKSANRPFWGGLAFVAAVLLGAAGAGAQVITYTFPGGTPTVTANGVAYTALTGGPFSHQVPIGGFATNGISSGGNIYVRTDAFGTDAANYTNGATSIGGNSYTYNMSEADAKAGGDFYQFSITPSTTLSLSAFSASVGGSSPDTTLGPYEMTFFLVGSTAADFSTSFELGQKTVSIPRNSTYAPGPMLLDLSGMAAVQNVAAGTQLYFRLYEAASVNSLDSSSASALQSQIIRFTDVSLYAAPEPSAWMLLLAAGGASAVWTWRRRVRA